MVSKPAALTDDQVLAMVKEFSRTPRWALRADARHLAAALSAGRGPGGKIGAVAVAQSLHRLHQRGLVVKCARGPNPDAAPLWEPSDGRKAGKVMVPRG